jgi:hypothetical protein
MAAFRTVQLCLAGIGLLTAVCAVSARAQEDPFDPDWYDPALPYVKLGIVEDGVYAVTGADLRGLGVSPDAVDPATLRLFENGREIPAWYTADPSAPLTDTASLLFVGRRNRGYQEAWAYDGLANRQSST